VQHKVAALFGANAPIPSWLPHGFVFIKWKTAPPSGPHGSTPYGQFTMTFTHAGTVLLWSMYGPSDAVDCKYPSATQQRVIGGRRISYIKGNHGDSAYFCVGRKGTQTELTTWDAHTIRAAVAMKIAALAHLAR
jgi:hypothetical protein